MSKKSLGRKKILFLINSLGRGGAEKMFAEQESALSEKGYRTYLLTLYGDFKFRHFLDLRGIRDLHRFVKIEDIEVLYSTLEEANLVARIIKLFNPKLGVVIREANDARRKPWKFKAMDLFLNFFTHKIIAVSKGVANSLKRYQRIHSKKIVVVNNGVEIPKVTKHRGIRRKLNSKFRILNVGNLTVQKNQLFLLKIFLKVMKVTNKEVELIIAGEGSERARLEKFIKENFLEEKVTLLGSVGSEKMAELYLSSHIFVSTSLWEGFPNVLLEAGSYSLPVVATKTFGTEELIEDGKSGFLVELGKTEAIVEKIKILIEDTEMRQGLALNLFNKVKLNYSLDKNISGLMNAFK